MGQLAREPVRLIAGENQHAVALPPVYTLEIIFPEDVTHGSVQLRPIDDETGFGARGEAIVDGVALVEGIVAGRYKLTAWGTGVSRGEMAIDVPETSSVVYEPLPVNALRIRVTDDAGAFAAAGFVDGDVIVRINGQRFEGEDQLAVLGAFLRGASEVTVTVERDGEELDLTVDPRGLFGANPGGSVDPTVR